MRATRNRARKNTGGVVPQLSLQNTDPSLSATEQVLSDAIEVRLTRLVAEAEAVRASYFAEQRAAERAALDAMGRASLRSQGNTLNRRIELMFTRAERSLIPGMGWRTVRLRKGRPPMSTYLAKVGAPRTGAALRRTRIAGSSLWRWQPMRALPPFVPRPTCMSASDASSSRCAGWPSPMTRSPERRTGRGVACCGAGTC